MTDRQALHVFIGPVQDFIAAGRRTRDFWAGSFLLSWLSGIAMQAVRGDGGSTGAITIPAVESDGKITEPTLDAIVAGKGSAVPPGPLVGTLVNRFRAEVNAGFDISVIGRAVRENFRRLASEVREVFIEPALAGLSDETRETVTARWNQQTDGSFFEVLAVMGEAPAWPQESRWLEQRKRLRTHQPPLAEAGADRCPIHGNLAELGGFSRQHEREAQQDFWDRLRVVVRMRMYEKGGAGAEDWIDARAEALEEELAARKAARETGDDSPDAVPRFSETLEIRDSERLSALALVKRLFPLMEAERISGVIGWMPDHMHGIHVPGKIWTPEEAQFALRNWPSTAFVAAIPWIVRAGAANPAAALSYAEDQYNTLGANPIWNAERPQHHRVRGIDELPRENGKLPKFSVLDGTLHFKRGLEKRRFDENPQKAERKAQELQARFEQFLEELRKARTNPITDGPASTHYAMLEMDGDGMGKLFSKTQNMAKTLSGALLDFGSAVPAVIREHDGVLIYAGADDVNAMLPIETAISCAAAINDLWRDKMVQAFADDAPTLSGSILFSDYQNALDDVRRLTHDRLDRVAKEGMGRNALAVAVMKSGGVVSEWASCWEDGVRNATAVALMDYARGMAASKATASRLPYLIRERFAEVIAEQDLFDDEKLLQFLAGELGDSGFAGLGASDQDKARKVVQLLRPWCRTDDPPAIGKAPRHVGGLLVARFLVQNAMWSYYDAWRNRTPEATP